MPTTFFTDRTTTVGRVTAGLARCRQRNATTGSRASPVIRAIFKARELALGGDPDTRPLPTALYDQMRSIGWVVLSEQAGREIVFGAVTQA